MANIQESMVEFERSRTQLMSISSQKQQLELQNEALKQAIDELKTTKEEKAYKAVGNIMIQKPTKEIAKELDEQQDSIELRIKTMQKQEDILIDKLNKLKAVIEKAQHSKQTNPQGTA